ncbi:MAG: DUF2971 domain-containing protein [Phycisphaerae bacterium]|jgi:hypothetical protein
MTVLYKYCDQSGIVKILETLELKLPYISDVNDPLECLPILYCPNDRAAIEAHTANLFKRRNLVLPVDYKEQLSQGKIPEMLEKSHWTLQREWNQRSCLLSVSKTAQNTVMWAHYTDKHKGAVIGIDYDNIFPREWLSQLRECFATIGIDYDNIPPGTKKECGIFMNPVEYSKKRPKINILTDITEENFCKVILTKSNDWNYEEEFRALFIDAFLSGLEREGLSCLKDFNGKKTWFLRLNPQSIREIVFGLYAEDSLKSAIRKLIERPELQHVKLYQAEETETYTLNLAEIKK